VFFRGETLTGIIDFYFACNDFLAYDLAVAINAWCFADDGRLDVARTQALVAAYRRVRPCGAAEIAALPLLAHGAALRFLATRVYDWLNRPKGAIVRTKSPLEFLHRLRFHRHTEGLAAYGLE
jgi:homoserine kinase type II